jgi:Uma2 family endonuclease
LFRGRAGAAVLAISEGGGPDASPGLRLPPLVAVIPSTKDLALEDAAMSAVPSPPAAPDLLAGGDPEIDYDSLVTEDHKPVDLIFVEKLYRLLTRPLYASWPGPAPDRPFLVLVNVGWFYQRTTPAVVPDCLFSLDVTPPEDLHVKQGHSYYQWDRGKSPDVVIEVVSDRTGGEEGHKKRLYARLKVSYYAVFDPNHLLSGETLRTYELRGAEYHPVEPGPWPTIGLGLRLWQGTFEGVHDEWLRWCDAAGHIIPTGEERARQADESLRQMDESLRQKDERIRELEAELRRRNDEPPDPKQ